MYAAVVACRNLLTRLCQRVVPAPVALYERLIGTWQTEMIYAAAKLGIADYLADGPKTVEELARTSGAQVDPLNRLMRALVCIGIFRRDTAGRYGLNRLAEPLLTDSPSSLRDMILYAGSGHSCNAWSRFCDVVQTGKSGYELAYGKALFDYLEDHPSEGAVFSAAMTSWSRLDAPVLAEGFDYSAFSKICDVAGGEGHLLSMILSSNPHLVGVLFDRAEVVARAEATLHSANVRNRCETVAGSFFEGVPHGCDAYILKDILHDWDDERALAILTECRRAAEPGATLLIMEMLIQEDDRPHPAKLLDMQMMTATHQGKQRSRPEFERLLRLARFSLTKVHSLPSPTSIVVATAV